MYLFIVFNDIWGLNASKKPYENEVSFKNNRNALSYLIQLQENRNSARQLGIIFKTGVIFGNYHIMFDHLSKCFEMCNLKTGPGARALRQP